MTKVGFISPLSIGIIPSSKQLSSVFLGRDVIRVSSENYPLTLRKVISNINNMPESIIHDLAVIHDKETGKVLQESDLRPEARNALVSHIDIKDNDSTNLQIVSMSDIGAFFEFGVEQHEVFASDSTIRGNLVGEWMDDHGFPPGSQGFIVGKPGTILDKNNPLMFMGKGYEKSWKNAPRVTDKFIKKI